MEISRISCGVWPRYAASRPCDVFTIDVEQQVQVSSSSKRRSESSPSALTMRDSNCTRFCFSQLLPSSQINCACASLSATPDAYALSSPGWAAARLTRMGEVQLAPASLDTAMYKAIWLTESWSFEACCDQ